MAAAKLGVRRADIIILKGGKIDLVLFPTKHGCCNRDQAQGIDQNV